MISKDAFVDQADAGVSSSSSRRRPLPDHHIVAEAVSTYIPPQHRRHSLNIAAAISGGAAVAAGKLYKLGCDEKCDLEEQRSNDFSSLDKDAPSLDENALLYGLEDIPPWYISLFLGLQHTFQFVTSCVAIPFILCTSMCMENDDPDKALIISTLIFVSGVITILQSTVGSTLPIVQGSTVSHLVPALAIMNLPKWQCPANLGELGEAEKREEWQMRIREIQGAVIFASMFEMLLAFTGCIGYLTKYITPLTVAPAITLIGLSLFRNAVEECSKNYYVSGSMVLLLIVFSQHLRNTKIALPWSKGTKFPIFQVFPVLLSIIIVWTTCSILTVLDVLPEGNLARVDSKKRIIEESSWFRIPYPFQFGWPTVSIGAVLGMLCGVLTSTVESIGDYYCCASILRAPTPPEHAMNRGIFIEGFGCVLSGIMGTGNASTSYSDNIGMLGVTKVGSRRVIQLAGVIMLIFGLVGKAGAVFVSLPDPILGGMFLFLFSLVMSVGIGTLKDVNLESSRNIFIISFSIFIGLAVSQWMNSNAVMLDTGIGELDTLLQVLLSTGMFVAGMTAFVLDNTISGTDEERGLTRRRANRSDDLSIQRDTTYDLPFGMSFIERFGFLKWIPISPTYEKHPISLLACNRSDSMSPLNDPSSSTTNRLSTIDGTNSNHVPV